VQQTMIMHIVQVSLDILERVNMVNIIVNSH